MTESEFLHISEQIFTRIDRALDDFDLDLLLMGNVLEIEFTDGAKLIINRHVANQEIWLAARSGGFHYHWHDGEWRNTRDDGEFFSQLGILIKSHCGKSPAF